MLRDTKNNSRNFPPYTAPETLPRSLCSHKRHATQHSSRTPHPSPLIPAFPTEPLCCTVIPKIAHFKASLELAWAHVGPRWLKIALNHLFEHPKWYRNNFGKTHC